MKKRGRGTEREVSRGLFTSSFFNKINYISPKRDQVVNHKPIYIYIHVNTNTCNTQKESRTVIERNSIKMSTPTARE